jgi:hypothetical protein
MIQLKHNEITISVDFKHDILTKIQPPDIIEKRYTDCYITINNYDAITSLSGRAVCSESDNFSKKEGRKRSFKRAISKIFDKSVRMLITREFNRREGYPFLES